MVLDDTHDNGYHLCHFPHASAPAAQTFHIPSSASETVRSAAPAALLFPELYCRNALIPDDFPQIKPGCPLKYGKTLNCPPEMRVNLCHSSHGKVHGKYLIPDLHQTVQN